MTKVQDRQIRAKDQGAKHGHDQTWKILEEQQNAISKLNEKWGSQKEEDFLGW
jgi:hypothetical protein